MSVEGLGGKKPRKDNIQKSLSVIDFMSDKDIKKKEIKKRGPRGKYNNPEANLRNDIVKELRKVGCQVMRVENSIIGRRNTGLGDLWVFFTRNSRAGWMEIKAGKNTLQDNQKKFCELCEKCEINYWVIRSVQDALNAIGYRRHSES